MTDAAIVRSEDGELDAFLARHPWPADMLRHGRPFDCLWHFELGMSAAELWPWVSDTSRMNRAMGVAKMDFFEKDGVLHGSSRNAGVTQEWVEVPWIWVAERTLTSIRVYERGLAHVGRAIYELVPLGPDRVRFVAYFGWVPRGLWQRILLRIGMNRLREAYRCVLTEIEAKGRRQEPAVFYDDPSPPLDQETDARLVDLAERVRAEVPSELVDRLVDWIRVGDPMDLHRIQVVALSRRWQIPEDQALRLFLHATRAGILSLSWDVICPHCRGVREEVRTLGEVPHKSACEVCAIDFETDQDNAIEITFHVHPSIREVPKLYFCSAEPATKTHIKLQQRVEPGGHVAVPTALGPGRYRARIGGETVHHVFDVRPAETDPKQLVWTCEQPLAGPAAPEPILVLENSRDAPSTFVVEEARWSDDALRPARLFSFQEFRDLFTEEYLGTDVQLAVGRQTILFTDVVGSTRLYASRGDPGAFMDVKRHFTEIYQEVKREGGAIVKTIGDAAMAAFVDPVRALRTARAIHRHFPPGREDLKLRVRVSLNSGPCIAVKLNTNIDYFGNTVNIAAKLQSLAGAGEVAFTEGVLDQPGVREYLASEGAELEHLVLDSPALGNPVPAVRWSTDSDAVKPAG